MDANEKLDIIFRELEYICAGKDPHEYKLDEPVLSKIDWKKFGDHRELIACILNNMSHLEEYKVQAFVRLLGGSDEIGTKLFYAIHDIVK